MAYWVYREDPGYWVDSVRRVYSGYRPYSVDPEDWVSPVYWVARDY
ncbi:MAG: hypothetical protein ACOYXN_07075 [Acidobacteriota bacterium]